MTSMVCSNHKEKKAKRTNSVKKNGPNREKNGTKKQKAASPGVEPDSSECASLQLLTTAPQ